MWIEPSAEVLEIVQRLPVVRRHGNNAKEEMRLARAEFDSRRLAEAEKSKAEGRKKQLEALKRTWEVKRQRMDVELSAQGETRLQRRTRQQKESAARRKAWR